MLTAEGRAFPEPSDADHRLLHRHFPGIAARALPVFLVNGDLDVQTASAAELATASAPAAPQAPPPAFPASPFRPRRRQHPLPPPARSPSPSPTKTTTHPRSPSPSPCRPRALCHDWDTEQVCAWVSTAVGLPQYARSFRQARIDGPGLLHLFAHEQAGVAGPSSPPRAYHRHHHLHAFAAPSSALERVLGVYDADHKERILAGVRRLKDGDRGALTPVGVQQQEAQGRGRTRRCTGCLHTEVAAPAKRSVEPRRAPSATTAVGGGKEQRERVLFASRTPVPPSRAVAAVVASQEEPRSLRKVRGCVHAFMLVHTTVVMIHFML